MKDENYKKFVRLTAKTTLLIPLRKANQIEPSRDSLIAIR
ncbi:uncharacterized protein CTRU02_209558 [Colletotrichum truncatum]|uniref:Uncharacterized protein n=1 Tax=Colletotrichum truncatum TaxID=5467 RepID=A0ACC3YUZ9_COLTU